MDKILYVIKAVIIGAGLTFSSIFHTAPPIIPTPTPIQIIIPTPTTYITNVNQQPSTSGAKIDCIGPDNKHLQLTQQDCDNFNAAWGKSSYPIVVNQNPTQQYNQNTQTTQGITQGQVNQECDQIIGDTSAICITNCGMTAKLDNNNCTGLDMAAFKQCLDDSTAKMTSCDDNCRNTANDGYTKCNIK